MVGDGDRTAEGAPSIEDLLAAIQAGSEEHLPLMRSAAWA
jgi:hypothetical protein